MRVYMVFGRSDQWIGTWWLRNTELLHYISWWLKTGSLRAFCLSTGSRHHIIRGFDIERKKPQWCRSHQCRESLNCIWNNWSVDWNLRTTEHRTATLHLLVVEDWKSSDNLLEDWKSSLFIVNLTWREESLSHGGYHQCPDSLYGIWNNWSVDWTLMTTENRTPTLHLWVVEDWKSSGILL